MKRFVTYIVLFFAFNALLVGCNSSKKCGCPTFGQKDISENTMACYPSVLQKIELRITSY